MSSRQHYLIISAVGPHRPELVNELSRACNQCACNLMNVKITTMGKEISVTLLVSGTWGAIAKMEAALPHLEQRLNLSLIARRTTEYTQPEKSMTYTVQVSAIDKVGILNGLSEFLLRLAIPIEEMSAHSYVSHTGTRMASLMIKINVPDSVHLATLREQFMSYCDDNNLDAFLEPVRHF